MQGRREWRIRTPFSELVLRLIPSAAAVNTTDSLPLLSELLYELQNLNPTVTRPLLEVHRALSGALETQRARTEPVSRQLGLKVERALRHALESGRLSVTTAPQSQVTARRRMGEAALLGPQATVDEETTFIGVRVLDAQGNPVQGERVLIEFADGTVRHLRTGVDGAVFVPGLNPGGPATVSLTDRNDPGEAEAPVPADTFEAKFVDETGQGIDGVEVVFSHSTQDESQITDGDGIAKIKSLEPVTVRFADMSAVGELLQARWVEARDLDIPEGDNVQVFGFRKDLEGVSLASGKLSTVVVTPPLGVLSAELWDKAGRAPHANRSYTLEGPMKFSGTTDQDGRLLHEDVFPGDYKLTLKLEFFEGKDRVTDTYETALVVQSP